MSAVGYAKGSAVEALTAAAAFYLSTSAFFLRYNNLPLTNTLYRPPLAVMPLRFGQNQSFWCRITNVWHFTKWEEISHHGERGEVSARFDGRILKFQLYQILTKSKKRFHIYTESKFADLKKVTSNRAISSFWVENFWYFCFGTKVQEKAHRSVPLFICCN